MESRNHSNGAIPKSHTSRKKFKLLIMQWYLKVLKQWSDFKGRARRKEYWMFTLFNIIFFIIAAILDNILGLKFMPEIPYGYIYLLYTLFIIVPSLAVAVRRLHDVGKSGWFYLIAFIPIIGAIWLLVLFVTDGKPGENQWGMNPKEVADPTL